MLKLTGIKPGSDITVMNVMYEKPQKDDDGKYGSDYIHIVFKDSDGIKQIRSIPNPKYTYYVAKPDIPIPYNLEWIEEDKTYPVTCNYRDIKASIAKELGEYETYKENIRNGQYRMNDNFFAHPRIFAADMNILNYVRMEFATTYKNQVCPITVAYYDIENDIIDSMSDEIVIGRDPVNVASIYFDANKTVYSFVLRNKRNPLIQEFEKDYRLDQAKYKRMVNEFITTNIGSESKTKKYRLDDINLVVGFFDNEAQLIVTFFSIMKKLSPDFAIAYNASYDLPYLMMRAEANGVDSVNLISDKEFSNKFYQYFVDREHYNDYEERGDYTMVSSKTTYLDQMIIYASRRKGQNAIPSFSLDSVASHECNVRKLDWHHITDKFALFPYKDFKTFWLYNINDTIVQACLEAQTEDIRYVFNNVIEMNTPYHKIFRQTNYLASKGMEFYKSQGLIMGNNINRFGSKPDVKFPGAFVAKPTKLSDKNKVKCHGYPIMKFMNGDDFDYKALYPSLMREFNMSISTQIGKIEIDNGLYDPIEELRLGSGGHYSEDLASYNFIQFAKRWMNLPDIEDMLKLCKLYYSQMRTPNYMIEQGAQPNLPMDKYKRVMRIIDPHRPMMINASMPDWLKEEVNKIREGIELK